MSIQSLAHVCIKSTDLDKTTEFYCGLLGMPKVFNFMRNGELIGFYFKAGNNTYVEVFSAKEIEKVGKQPLNHFCLETDSIKELRQKLFDHGCNPGEIKMGADNSVQFWVEDPSGLNMEFHEYTDKSSQRTGADVEVDW